MATWVRESKDVLAMNYRCFYLDKSFHGMALAFEAESDSDAVRTAETMIRSECGQHDRFEIWQSTRLVFRCGTHIPQDAAGEH